MSIPIDVLNIILRYCNLKIRYQCSLLSKKYFPFDEHDWLFYGKHYNLENASRGDLKSLLQRDYRSQFSITHRLNSLWSLHFKAPLVVWSPWTISRYCVRYNTKMDFYFREYRFVNFVRELAKRFRLKTSCLRKKNLYTCVVSTVWLTTTKRLSMKFYPSGHVRYNAKHFLKSYSKSRALLYFASVHGQLALRVQKLEFLV